jgi:hypothetical protein
MARSGTHCSPGFAVDAFTEDGARLVPLGGVFFDGGVANGMLKTSGGRRPIQIVCIEDAEEAGWCPHSSTIGSGAGYCATLPRGLVGSRHGIE